MGRNPLSMADIAAWLDINQVDDIDDRARLIDIFKHLDSIWLQKMSEKDELNRKS
jgi:hypothetical protein